MIGNGTMKQILTNHKGETIIETLVSALLVSLAMILLASMLMASQKIMEQSDKTVSHFYQTINSLESRNSTSTTANATVKIEDVSGQTEIHIPVTLYQTSDPNLKFYEKR